MSGRPADTRTIIARTLLLALALGIAVALGRGHERGPVKAIVLLLACAAPALAVVAARHDIAARVDALLPRRDQAPVVARMESLLGEALEAAPDEYALLWRMARLRWWQADGTAGEEKKRLGKDGWDFAERALRADPGGVEGHYYAALCIGAYSQASGILRALREGLEGRFNSHLEHALRTAPDFDLGGPYIAKGRYWYELPWPKRSLAKSAQSLQKAVSRHPENLRARLYLAETQLAAGDAPKARETLAPVVAGDTAYDPPEGKRVVRLARALQRQIEAASE